MTRAAASFEKACEVHPGSPEAYYWLGADRFHILLHHRSDAEGALPTPEFKALTRGIHEPLEKLIRIDNTNAESHAILGTVIGMEIAQGARSRFWGGRALQKHQRLAVEYGENNPRVQYLLGVSTFQGGKGRESAERALSMLLKAETLFAQEEASDPPPQAPRWGYDHCLVFIGRAYRRLGEPEHAEKYFANALTVNPSSRLAERELASLEQ